jgi:hypothetical protein
LLNGLQTKLTVNEPGDEYEQEADRVAEHVMRMPDPAIRLQRQCSCAETGGNCAECAPKPVRLQRQAAGSGYHGYAPGIVHQALRGAGKQLDGEIRSFMEFRFGRTFEDVRIHTGAEASESAAAVNARAYTVGRNIVFSDGRFAPGTVAGRSLLAHELAHVVQQRGGMETVPHKEASNQSGGAHELWLGGGPKPGGEGLRLSAPASNSYLQRGFGELRVAEARMEAESRISSSPIDGQFWILPPGVPRDSVPLFDDDDTQVVVGFRSGGSVTWTYDLEGRVVSVDEPGLETPLIDPIDILAGGIAGWGRGLIGGAVRSEVRSVAGGAGRGAVMGAGLRAASRTLARRALTAIRGVYRAIRFRGPLNFSATTAAHMADVARRVPQHILKLAIRFGARAADPQGVAGAFRYVIPMIRNGRQYTLEVVLREADQTILHFLYR